MGKILSYIIPFVLLGLLIWFVMYCRKFSNPYKLYMVFGRKGCGKTTYLCKLAIRYLSKGWTVYCTESIPGTIKIRPEDFGYIDFVQDSVVLMDEVGIIFDNRNFKQFKPEVRDYFKLQRHCRVLVYLFSQTFDVDAKIRTLTDSMFYITNYFNVFSVVKKISRKMVIVSPEGDNESRLAYKLIIQPWFLWPFGARDYIWIPKYIPYFNSYDVRMLNLSPAPTVITPWGGKMPRKLQPRKKRRKFFKR